MKLGLDGRSVLVMGGSQGIGLACARLFHAEGANVTIAARGALSLSEAAAAMPGSKTIVGDVTQPADLERIVAAAGRVDVLVNNAGGPPAGTIESLTDEDWAAAIELTLMSAVRATKLVLPAMRSNRWGRIINISSYGVKQPVPGLSLSNSVRMAVLGWAKTLSRQVATDAVTVNTVCPGWTRTDRVASLIKDRAGEAGDSAGVLAKIVETIPLGRLGEPEDVANLVVFLASEAAAYITGTAIQVDGGLVEGYG
jgi:3-oxoacyl-[acyl-carrier protein] reductase